jgi:hypothetical protein
MVSFSVSLEVTLSLSLSSYQSNTGGCGGSRPAVAPKLGVVVRLSLLTHHFLQRLLDPPTPGSAH